MYRIFEAESDGDLYADTRYDQTTPFYNMLMDALETAQEVQYQEIPVVQLRGGVYDFYAGYANWSNGSGFPRSIPIQSAAYIEVRGAKDGKTILRLHGKMQWMFFTLCEGVKFMDVQIEYADDDVFCPIANPRSPDFYPVGEPDALDRSTMVFDRCKSLTFERVKVLGEQISWVFSACQDVILKDVSGTAEITVSECYGVLQCENVRCRLVVSKVHEKRQLMLAPEMEMLENAVLFNDCRYAEDGECVCHI